LTFTGDKETVTQEFKDLIGGLLQPDARKRPTINEIREISWLKQVK